MERFSYISADLTRFASHAIAFEANLLTDRHQHLLVFIIWLLSQRY